MRGGCRGRRRSRRRIRRRRRRRGRVWRWRRLRSRRRSRRRMRRRRWLRGWRRGGRRVRRRRRLRRGGRSRGRRRLRSRGWRRGGSRSRRLRYGHRVSAEVRERRYRPRRAVRVRFAAMLKRSPSARGNAVYPRHAVFAGGFFAGRQGETQVHAVRVRRFDWGCSADSVCVQIDRQRHPLIPVRGGKIRFAELSQMDFQPVRSRAGRQIQGDCGIRAFKRRCRLRRHRRSRRIRAGYGQSRGHGFGIFLAA